MPRPVRDDDDDFDDEDGLDDEELPDGVYHDDDPATFVCPHCGGELLEDSPRCPRCESYLSREDVQAQPRSWFWGVMMALALLAAFWWVLR